MLGREHSPRRERRRLRGQRTAEAPKADTPGEAPLGALGSGSDYSPFFDHAGIPSVDMAFGGDYGVYHSLYDDFYWMKHFGDPTFAYHAALARMLGTLALRLDEADILPFDYSAYATEIERAVTIDSYAPHEQTEAKPQICKPVLGRGGATLGFRLARLAGAPRHFRHIARCRQGR